MSEEQTRPSSLATFAAYFRGGLKDVAKHLQAFPESIQPVEEPGTFANPTSAMVTQEIGTFQGYQSMLEEYAARGDGREQQDRGIDR